MPRTQRQQVAIDVVNGTAAELLKPGLARKRRKALSAQLSTVRTWLEEEFPSPAGIRPFIEPVNGHPVSQRFGENVASYPEYNGHPGIDYACPEGTPAAAPAGGTVMTSGADPAYPGRGLHAVIDHGGGLTSYLMHLSRTIAVPGEAVAQGDSVGLSGNTGWSSGPHLHWGLRDDAQMQNGRRGFIDPAPLLQQVLP